MDGRADEYVRVGRRRARRSCCATTPGQVNLVMATADGQPIDVTVQVDDRPPTTVTVHAPRTSTRSSTTRPPAPTRLRLTAGGARAPGLRVHLRRLARRAPRLHRAVRRRGRVVPRAVRRPAGPRVPRHGRGRVGRRATTPRRRCRPRRSSSLGFATVFASFGVIAGLVGRSLSPVQDVVQRVGGVVIIIFGLALLGVIRGPLSRERRAITTLPKVHRAGCARSSSASPSARRGARASDRSSAPRSSSRPTRAARSRAACC